MIQIISSNLSHPPTNLIHFGGVRSTGNMEAILLLIGISLIHMKDINAYEDYIHLNRLNYGVYMTKLKDLAQI